MMTRAAREVASPRVVNIADLRRLAEQRLPRAVFDYLDGGAEDEVTLRENCRCFCDYTFRPRYAVKFPEYNLRTTVLGAEISFPAFLAPVGYSRVMHPGGEVVAAAAAGAAGTGYTLSTISGHKLENVRAVLSWEDLKWIREMWPGPIIIKGVLIGEDARRAVDEGAAAIVVSNHGGRQLDCVSSSLRALPEIVAAVNGQAEILMDGGVRRGSDIVKALCLGARAVLIGRAYAYGLAAAGYPGVERAIQILKNDFQRTMRLLGCHSVSALDASCVNYPREWRASFRD